MEPFHKRTSSVPGSMEVVVPQGCQIRGLPSLRPRNRNRILTGGGDRESQAWGLALSPRDGSWKVQEMVRDCEFSLVIRA